MAAAPFVGPPADAEGLDFLCDSITSVTPKDLSLVDGDKTTFAGLELTIEGAYLDRTGTRHDIDLPPIDAAALFSPQRGFSSDIDRDGTLDVTTEISLRIGTVDTLLKRVLQENFAQPADLFGETSGLGVDVKLVSRRDASVRRIDAKVGVAILLKGTATDGSPISRRQRVLARVDGTRNPLGLPSSTVIGALFRSDGSTGILGVRQDVAWGTTAPPVGDAALGTGLQINTINDRGEYVAGVIDVDLGWSKTSPQFAFGMRSVCTGRPGDRSTAHLAWQRTPDVPPNGEPPSASSPLAETSGAAAPGTVPSTSIDPIATSSPEAGGSTPAPPDGTEEAATSTSIPTPPTSPTSTTIAAAAPDDDAAPAPSGEAAAPSAVGAPATTVDITVRTGIGEGLRLDPVYEPTPGAPPVPVPAGAPRADKVVLDGQIVGLPQRADLLLHPDDMSLTRSLDTPMELTLDRLQLAADDPGPADRPLVVSGTLTDIPDHILATTTWSGQVGTPGAELRSVDVSGWTLGCGAGVTPAGDTLPPDMRTCGRAASAAIPVARVLLTNALPDAPAWDALVQGLPRPPAAPDGSTDRITPHALYGSVEVPRLGTLFRVGGRLQDVRRVLFDSTTSDDSDSRIRLAIDKTTPEGQIAFRYALIDGDRLEGDAVLPRLPRALDVRISDTRSPRTGAHVTRADWSNSEPVSVTAGQTALYEGDATTASVRAEYRIGAAGTGGLPGAGSISVIAESASFTAPSSKTITYEGSTPVNLKAGVVLSRSFSCGAFCGRRYETTRAYVEATVGPRLTARLEGSRIFVAEPDKVKTVDVTACDSTTSCTNAVDLTVVHTPSAFTSPTSMVLLNRPALPTPTTEQRPAPPVDDGAAFVRRIDDAWGADVRLTNLVGASLGLDPVEVRLRTRGPRLAAFPVNGVFETQGEPTLVVATSLSWLPSELLIRIQPDGGSAARPWIWLNTESTAITSPPALPRANPDPPGTRPRLRGIIRIGRASQLTGVVDAGFLDPPSNGARISGVFETGVPSGRATFQVAADLAVPKQLTIARPIRTECDGSNPATCARNPATTSSRQPPRWEADTWEQTQIAVRSSIASFGQFQARIHLVGKNFSTTTHHQEIRARVANVPGSLDASVTLAGNRRLPWTFVTLTADGKGSALGEVSGELFDHIDPGTYRTGKPAGVSAAVPWTYDPSDHDCELGCKVTPNFAVTLRNVTDTLRMDGKVFAAESRQVEGGGWSEEAFSSSGFATNLPSQSECDSEDWSRSASAGGDLGFVHANLDLGNRARSMKLNVAAMGKTAGILQSDAPLSGWVNAKLDELQIQQYQCSEVADVNGNLRLHLKVDLPILVDLDRVQNLRFGVGGTSTIAIDDDSAAHGGQPSTLSIAQRPLPGETGLSERRGAFYWYRFVRLWADPVIEDFDVRTTEPTPALRSIAIEDWGFCKDGPRSTSPFILPTPCYVTGPAQVGGSSENTAQLGPVAGNLTGRARYASTKRSSYGPYTRTADFLLDPVWNSAARDEMFDESGGIVDPGGTFYEKYAAKSPPLQRRDLQMPVYPFEATDRRSATQRLSIKSFISSGLYRRCRLGEPADQLWARGADGTRYEVSFDIANCPDEGDNSFVSPRDPVLTLTAYSSDTWVDMDAVQAEDRNLPVRKRWTITLPHPVGLDPDDGRKCLRFATVTCTIDIKVNPMADGSVQVTSTTSFDDGRPAGPMAVRTAWVDASGHPGGTDVPKSAEVVGFGSASVSVPTGTTTAVLDPCKVAAGSSICRTTSGSGSYRWFFGDGEVSAPLKRSSLGTVEHSYPAGARTTFRAILVRYSKSNGKGEVVDRLTVAVSVAR